MDEIFREGLADRVRAAGNQYRNHPIQGGVADAMLAAMADIDTDLVTRFPTARPVQSVHDSLVIECDIDDALAVRSMLVTHMENGMRRFFPSVEPLAEADVQWNLSDSSIIPDEELLPTAAVAGGDR
jgi:DNA polymerase I-like protein with 3'-5' exonuclease and polymerase domains